MIILGLDQSPRHIGWCRGEPGGKPVSGCWDMPDYGDNEGLLFLAVRRLIDSEIQPNAIKAIFFEQIVALIHRGKQGGTSINLPTLLKQSAVVNGIQAAAAENNIPAKQVIIGEWRARMLGAGQAPKNIRNASTWWKDVALAECAKRGFLTTNHHEAEARLIWDFGCQIIDPSYAFRSNEATRRAQDRMAIEKGAML